MRYYLKYTLLLVIWISSLSSCSATSKYMGQPIQEVSAQFSVVDTVSHASKGRSQYDLPEIPSYIREPIERGRYLLEHYFDSWSKEARESVANVEMLEQSLVDYLAIYQSLPRDVVSRVDLLRPLEQTRDETLSQILLIYTKYLYEQDSPLKHHEDYLQVLQWTVESDKVQYVDQVVYKDMLSLVSKNREGSPAIDFAMKMNIGEKQVDTTLYALRGKPTVLIFYSPGCDRCDRLIEAIKSDEILARGESRGAYNLLYVTLVYSKEQWEQEFDRLPTFGTPVYNDDMQILDKSLYDLTSTPAIYIIDKHGIVLRKDATLKDVRQYIISL